jgi:predicted nuclease with TOPRIM domain
MADRVNVLLQIIFYVGAGVVGAAAIFALFRSRYIKATVEELRGDRDDQAKRIERLESENTRLEKENTRRDAIIEQLKNQNSTLKDALSGKAQLNHLQEQLDAHDKRVDERHAILTSQMEKVTYSNATLLESNQALVDSNQYMQAALLDFLKKQEEEK